MSTHREKMIATATWYVGHYGLSVIPMGKDKRPMIKWLEYQDRHPTVKEILSWPVHNLAIITGKISNLVVVDCESKEDYEWFWRNKGKSTVVVQTRRGYHLYFKHPGVRVMNGIHIENRYDVRGDGGYVMAPPSIHSDGHYRWVKPLISTADLPLFNTQWRPETQQFTDYDKVIHDGMAYIAKIFAIEGQGGHDATFSAAACLKDSGMSEAEAYVALKEWNETNAKPPWSDRELLHKIRSVYSK